MSLYFDHPVQTAKNSGLIHSIIQWHPRHPILAVASYHDTTGGELNFFFEEVTIDSLQYVKNVKEWIEF